MKRNILILIAGMLTVLAGALLKLQTHSDFSSVLMIAGMAMGAFGASALFVQIWKRAS